MTATSSSASRPPRAATEYTPLTAMQPSAARRLSDLTRRLVLWIAMAIVASIFISTMVARLEQVSSPSSEEHPTTPVVTMADTPSVCGIAKNEAGFIKLANNVDDHYFYWYFESRTSPLTDPLLIWLTGGPECSSLFAMLVGNGPCSVNANLTTTVNPYGWNTAANVIWINQPTNVGFSYGSEADNDSNETHAGENMYWFLQGFLDKHRELEGREVFISGESYAGHYVPTVAHAIWTKNQELLLATTSSRNSSERAINLKGIAIGNGGISPVTQTAHSLDMINNTYNITLMNETAYAHAKDHLPRCVAYMGGTTANDEMSAQEVEEMMGLCMNPFAGSGRNPYDIRMPCDDDTSGTTCYEDSAVSAYLNSDTVQAYLSLTGPSQTPTTWILCNETVNNMFPGSGDGVLDCAPMVADLLNDGGIRVLLYAGDADTACNWYGVKAWATDLEWAHGDAFRSADDHTYWTGNGTVNAGEVRSYKNQLTFLRVSNAGHMVPRDQPAVALEMISTFLQGGSFSFE